MERAGIQLLFVEARVKLIFEQQISEESTTEETAGVGSILSGSRESSLMFTVGRQLSQTHSEPDTATGDSGASGGLGSKHLVERSVTWAEPRIKVIPPASHTRSALLSMHHEYTSITDELETVCGLLSPPKSPSGLLTPLGHRSEQSYSTPKRSRHYSEMSNPEMARYLEKETLRNAEDSDYQLMEGLIQRRLKSTDEDKFHNNAFFLATTPDLERYQGRLRRASAIEGDYPCGHISTPLGTPIGGLSPEDTNTLKVPSLSPDRDKDDILSDTATAAAAPSSSIIRNAEGSSIKEEIVSRHGSIDSESQLRPAFSASRIFNKVSKEVQL